MIRLIPVRVLVIDDDAAVCRRVSGWLGEAAYDAVTFTDPKQGVRHAAGSPPLLALVDLRLPDADGAEVIASLREASPQTRVIAMMAFPEARPLMAAMRAGARDVLEKPIQQPTLLEALERQLADLGMTVRDEQEFNRRLGARIRGVRSRAERTLADVAEASGLSAAALSQIELGKTATSTWTLARICCALRTPLARLFEEV